MWRDCAPHVLAALVRRYGDFDAVEDAVQEALLAAARQWPSEGVPDNPRGWLIDRGLASAGRPLAQPSGPGPSASCARADAAGDLRAPPTRRPATATTR